jgi:predicted nucleic acid-binding protein
MDHAAPHVIDVEVLSIVRRDLALGRLDRTAAHQAVEDLRGWPGERFGHRSLLERAWELRDNVRAWDAVYVALAEALDATLLTLDRRLGRVPGLACLVDVVAT